MSKKSGKSNVKITEVPDEASCFPTEEEISNKIEEVKLSSKSESSRVEKKVLYKYGSNFFVKPEDKVRFHLEQALLVSGMDGRDANHVLNYLFANNLLFQIVNPNATEVFMNGGEYIYSSEEDAKNNRNPLNGGK
jgi:hypothetical protein